MAGDATIHSCQILHILAKRACAERQSRSPIGAGKPPHPGTIFFVEQVCLATKCIHNCCTLFVAYIQLQIQFYEREDSSLLVVNKGWICHSVPSNPNESKVPVCAAPVTANFSCVFPI